MLKREPIDAAHHHDDIKDNEQSGHGTTETKTRVQDHQRNGEQREPDVSAQPALHRSNAPKDKLLAHAEERREDKYAKGGRAENQAKRCPANAAMFGWFLDER